MAKHSVFRSILLASGVCLFAACATQPPPDSGALDEKYFEREASHYQKFQHEGQVVYCQTVRNVTSLIPHKHCLTEAALRERVADWRKSRNAVVRGGPPYVSTVPGGVGR